MDIADITKLTKSLGETNLDPKSSDEEKIKEAFKTIFVEKMVDELMKTGNLVGGVEGLQKDLYEQQIKESLSQYFMDGAGIRWNEVLGLSKMEVKDKNSDGGNES